MSSHPNLAATAFLIADNARAAILVTLLDGRARPANELAYAAGVTAQTASSHLAKLLDGGMLAVEKEGRHRYYRLNGPQVAQALENLALIAPGQPVRRKPLSREAAQLRFARCCYDHLAGQVGVAMAQGLQERGYLICSDPKQFAITPDGSAWFGSMGLDVGALKPNRRGLARQCLDWTERQHHLAGPLGVQFLALLCRKNWLRRAKSSRGITVTPEGWIGLRTELGIERISPE